MGNQLGRACACAASVLASGTIALAATPNFTLVDLGTLPGSRPSSYGTAISDRGLVVGYTSANSGASNLTFLAGRSQPMADISPAGALTSYASGVFDGKEIGRTVVGRYVASSTDHGLFAATPTETLKLLDAPNETGESGDIGRIQALATSPGVVGVGNYFFPGALHRTPAIFTRTGPGQMSVQPLPTLGGFAGSANGITHAAQYAVVGTSALADGTSRAFVYDTSRPAGSQMTDLGTLGGFYSYGYAINESGVAVGNATVANGDAHAFMKAPGQPMVDLGTLGGGYSVAYAVNFAGQVIGTAPQTRGSPFQHAWIYLSGQMTDLNTVVPAGYNHITLEGGSGTLNDYGQIAASAYVGDTGLEHALILTPTTPVTVATAPTTANATMVSKVAGGLNYSTVPVLTNARIGSHNTTAKLLGGSASENKPLDIAFEDASAGSGTFASLASDRLSFSGTDSDRFVLSLTYDEAAAIALYGSETLTRLLWLSPQTGQFMNAVDGNSAGSVAFFAGDHAYTTADFVLGRYGVDTTNNTVWAVLDHNSVFAAGLVPEPTVMGLLSMTGGMLLRRRGRTACV